jgi:protein-L-isoaspartate(D-aspartate) O-methyltransferase
VSRFSVARRRMVEDQLGSVDAPQVLAAMAAIPREHFVPPVLQGRAYEDRPLPIACRQTISQPWIVARMTQLLELTGAETVLEIGTGSGYQAAVLGKLARRVITVERHGELARTARARLEQLGLRNVTVLQGDGSMGRSEYAPYDRILVTCGAPEIPTPLRSQLKVGGHLVVPVGDESTQTLVRLTRGEGEDDDTIERFDRCVFVPLVGRFGWKD